MEKSARKIFQPNPLSALLIEGACDKGSNNISDFTNKAIENYFTPYNEALRKETYFLFQRILDHEQIAPEELKATLARCVEILKNYPISDMKPLEQIFIHFTYKKGRRLRYDYIQIVDRQQDDILHRLNEVLKTVDDDYTLGTHEFGERSRTVFEHWDELCRYSEIYTALSTIIECEDIYYPLDTFRTIDLVKWLDNAIMESRLEAIKTPYPTALTTKDKYYGIYYEVNVYLTDNGYVELSGDYNFDHMPQDIRDYYHEYESKHSPYGDAVTEEDLKEITAIEAKGRMLFRRLNNPNKK